MPRPSRIPDNVYDLRVRAARDAETISMMASEIAMLRRKQGELREELEQFRDRSPSPAVVANHARGIGL